MHRTIVLSAMLIMILSHWMPVLDQESSPTPSSDDLLPPGEELSELIDSADAPKDLPGNDDDDVGLTSWEDAFGEPLDNAVGAWVLTGSPDLPIASLIVFESPEDAQTGTADYRRDNSSTLVDGLEVWSVADRGKWVCINVGGPLLIIGQAEPQRDESDDDVQARSCAVVATTHRWVVDLVTSDTSTPEAVGSLKI